MPSIFKFIHRLCLSIFLQVPHTWKFASSFPSLLIIWTNKNIISFYKPWFSCILRPSQLQHPSVQLYSLKCPVAGFLSFTKALSSLWICNPSTTEEGPAGAKPHTPVKTEQFLSLCSPFSMQKQEVQDVQTRHQHSLNTCRCRNKF